MGSKTWVMKGIGSPGCSAYGKYTGGASVCSSIAGSAGVCPSIMAGVTDSFSFAGFWGWGPANDANAREHSERIRATPQSTGTLRPISEADEDRVDQDP